jgi:hypothetical protein
MEVLLDNENTAQLVIVAKDLAARDRLQRQLAALLASQFGELTTRVSPRIRAASRLADKIPRERA